MPNEDTRNHKGLKVGAATVVVAGLLVAGGFGINALVSSGDSKSNASTAEGETPSTSTPSTDSGKGDQAGTTGKGTSLDPKGDEDTKKSDPTNGNATERIVLNPDGTTSVVRVEERASESGDGVDQINPSEIKTPADQPKTPSTTDGGDKKPETNPDTKPGGDDNGGKDPVVDPTDPTDPTDPVDPVNPGGGGNGGGGDKPVDPVNPGGGGNDGGGPTNPGGGGETPSVSKVNIQELIDYINNQRNLDDSNQNGEASDSVSQGAEPNADLYAKAAGALVVVDDNGRPIDVIWADMSQGDRDALLKNLSKSDQTRIYGVNRDDAKAQVSIDQYTLRNTEARGGTYEVEAGGSVTISADTLLKGDRVLVDDSTKGASNILNVSSTYEGVTWNPETGEVTVDASKYTGDNDEIVFEYTIQHDQNPDRNKSGNVSTSTSTVTVKIKKPTTPTENPGEEGGTPESPAEEPKSEPEVSPVALKQVAVTSAGLVTAPIEAKTNDVPAQASAPAPQAEVAAEAPAPAAEAVTEAPVTEAPVAEAYVAEAPAAPEEAPASEAPAAETTTAHEPTVEEAPASEPAPAVAEETVEPAPTTAAPAVAVNGE